MTETYYAIPLPVMIRLFKHTIGLAHNGLAWITNAYRPDPSGGRGR